MASTTTQDSGSGKVSADSGSGDEFPNAGSRAATHSPRNSGDLTRLSLVDNALSGDSAIILRKLLQLRLQVLGALVGFLWLLDTLSKWPVNYPMALVAISCGIAWSLGLLLRKTGKTTSRDVMRELVIDGIWLTLVVYASGRSENPFIYYFLVLIAIASTVLRARSAWLFSLTGVCVYTLFLYLDIKNHFAHMSDDYQFHLLGMWINFCGSSLVTCYFISKLAASLRSHQAQLIRAREETLQNEQLIGIGTLAASTVHALGTPLSTLTVLLGEMHHNADTAEKRQDMDLMLTQISRCKDTMKKLSLLAEQERDPPQLELVTHLAEALSEHYAIVHPLRPPQITCTDSCSARQVPHSLLLRHALINLIDNAVEAARDLVKVEFADSEALLLITITDDGPGMSQRVLNRWGKPQHSSKETGLGIGVFLANSTIERLGGTVAIGAFDGDTAAAQNLQTRIIVTLPLAET